MDTGRIGMLPKQIYFYWGNEIMSFFRYMTFNSFAHYNPDWQINLIVKDSPTKAGTKNPWAEEQDYAYYKGQDFTAQAHKLANVIELSELVPGLVNYPDNEVADYLKWYILSQSAGVFADTDILFVKQLDYDLLDVQTGLFKYLRKAYPVGFLVGNHSPFFRVMNTLADRCMALGAERGYQDIGPLLLREMLERPRHHIRQRLTYLPNELVYPFIDSRVERDWQTFLAFPFMAENTDYVLPEKCVGIHWYGGCKAARQYNEVLTPLNVPDCIIGKEIDKIL